MGRRAGPRRGAEAPVRSAAAALGVMAVLAPVVLLPGIAWDLAGRLRPAEYPAVWLRARPGIARHPGHGSVLLLPSSASLPSQWYAALAVSTAPWSATLS